MGLNESSLPVLVGIAAALALVLHRADVHGSLLEGAQMLSDRIELATSTQVQRIEQDDEGVTVLDAQGGRHRSVALIGADGVKPVVRRQLEALGHLIPHLHEPHP